MYAVQRADAVAYDIVERRVQDVQDSLAAILFLQGQLERLDGGQAGLGQKQEIAGCPAHQQVGCRADEFSQEFIGILDAAGGIGDEYPTFQVLDRSLIE